VGAVVGLVWAVAAGRTYSATAELLLPQRDPVAALLGVSSDPALPERDFDTRVGLITVPPVAAAVRRELRLREPTDELLGRVSTSVEGNSGIVSVTARAHDARTAARIANAFGRAYSSYRADVTRRALTARVAGARRELQRLGPGAELTREGRDLAAGIRRVQTAAAFQGGDAELVRPATAATASAGWGAPRRTALGALLAALAAAAAVALLARVDHALHTDDDVEEVLGVPLVARVSRDASDGATSPGGNGASGDAYAALAARLAFGQSQNSAVALLFTSLGGGGQTAEVVLGVAAGLRTLGRKVVAVEADLREPRFADELGHRPVGGLAAVLRGRASLATELVEIEAPVRPRADAHAWALPAGRPESRPQELLAADTMGALMRRARRRAPFVLVAAAPLARLPEAQILAPLVDGAVLVVRAGATTDDAARRARRRLEDVGVPVVGAVLVDEPIRARPTRRRIGGGVR
jgi:Mrp family chromosome partitioning ATPase